MLLAFDCQLKFNKNTCNSNENDALALIAQWEIFSNRGMTRSNQYEFHVKQYLAQIPTESGTNTEKERESKLKILWRVSS